jgi:hypothetical protein
VRSSRVPFDTESAAVSKRLLVVVIYALVSMLLSLVRWVAKRSSLRGHERFTPTRMCLDWYPLRRAFCSLIGATSYLLTYLVVTVNGKGEGRNPPASPRPRTHAWQRLWPSSPAFQGLVLIMVYGLDKRLRIVQLLVQLRVRLSERFMTEEEKEAGFANVPYDDCYTGEIAEARKSRTHLTVLGTIAEGGFVGEDPLAGSASDYTELGVMASSRVV